MLGSRNKCYHHDAELLKPRHIYSTLFPCMSLSFVSLSSGSCPARVRYSMALSIKAELSMVLPSANALDALAEYISARLLK